jgi:tRNA dimethylallyltransferase
LVEEVRSILARGYPASSKPFESLGYRQALDALEGRCSLAEAVASTQLATRRYAKRQWTWFRRDPSIEWLPGFGCDPAIQEQAFALARRLVSASG